MSKKTAGRKKGTPARPHYLSAPTYQGERRFPAKAVLFQYGEAGFTSEVVPMGADHKTMFLPGVKNWLAVRGFSEEEHINRLCRSIGLHGFDIRDLLSEQQISKVAVYDKVIFVILSAFRPSENTGLEEITLAFALGDNFLISFQEAENPLFDEVEKAIADDALQVRGKPMDFLLYVLFNAVNAFNTNTIMRLEDELTELEEQLINRKTVLDVQQLIHERRIHYMAVKRSLVGLREEYLNITHTKSLLIHHEDMVYFHNFDDRLRSTIGNLEAYHESLVSLSDIYYNNNNLIMNEIIKRLTVVSTIFIPLTFLVGVWGMNFDFMPETKWRYGYLAAWACFAAIGTGTFIFMKKKKWF